MRDVHKLRDYVEHSVVGNASGSDEGHEEDTDEFEILKESPMIWDGKYKLEIGRMLIVFAAYFVDLDSSEDRCT